jgi:hypothetical protein
MTARYQHSPYSNYYETDNGSEMRESGSYEYDRTPVVRGEIAPALPNDVHVLPKQRSGDTERNFAMDHLNEAHAHGYIDQAELDARVNHAMQGAKTKTELDALTRDLPPRMAPADTRSGLRRAVGRYNFSKPVYYVPTLLMLIFVGLFIAIEPVAVAGTDKWLATFHGLMLCIPLMTAGATATVGGLSWLIAKAVDD